MTQKNLKPEIIRLHEEGKSYKEIVKILSCSRGTISYHLSDEAKQKAKLRTKKCREINKKNPLNRLPKPCLHCQTSTTNAKFCSSNCSAKYNQALDLTTKRKLKKLCLSCETQISKKFKYCSNCNPCKGFGDISLQDAMYEYLHKSSAFALVRTRARVELKKRGVSSCLHCGYNLHIEACHVKPLADYPLDTLISVVNSEDNLIGLCCNCHWELDNGYLSIETIKKAGVARLELA